MTLYRHTQFGWAVTAPMLLLALVASIVALRDPNARPAAWFLVGLFVVVIALFASLTVCIRDGWLECSFGVGLIRRRIRLTDVRDVQPVRNRWWYGWGIRLTPHGWLWNVSGLDAVELTFANGRKFRVGSDEPNQLVAALRSECRLPL